jgi:RNA polymerase sigma-70 factor (ECF subfamily)
MFSDATRLGRGAEAGAPQPGNQRSPCPDSPLLRVHTSGDWIALADPSAFSDAYERFAAPVRAKCRRMLGDGAAAEDVTQEVFLRLWKNGPAVGAGAENARTVMAWLYRTGTRLAIDVLRERRRVEQRRDGVAESVPCAVHVEDHVAARNAIASLGAEVSDDELEAAVLCRFDGLSQPEAAEVLGVSERTVRRRLDRFDARVRAIRKEIHS